MIKPAIMGQNGLLCLIGRGVLLVSLLLGLLNPVTALGAIPDLRYQAGIAPDNTGTLTSYGLLELPDEVLGQARTNTPDLRIYAEGEEIPFVLVPSNLSEEGARYKRVDIYNQGQDAAGNLVFEIRIPSEQWVDELRLLTPDTNFVRRVKVEGSRDQTNWTLLQAESTVFDLTNEKKSRNTTVLFAKTNFPILRVTILGGGKQPLRLEGLELTPLTPQESIGELRERPHDFQTTVLEDGIEEIVLDLYHSNLPTQELDFITGDENFSRRVEVYGSQTKENWSLLTKGELYFYQLDKASADQRSLQFKATYRYLKLKVFNQDNRPLNLQAVKVRGTNPAVMFRTEPSKRFILYWGSQQLQKPAYDLEKLETNIDYNKLSRLKLEKPQANPMFALIDTRPWTERNAWLLNAVLIIVVLVLVVVIVRNIRKLPR